MSFFYYIAISILLYFGFCRLCNESFRWYKCLLYAMLSCGLCICKGFGWISEIIYIVLITGLLTGYGVFFHEVKFLGVLAASSLVVSIYSIADGVSQSLIHWGFSTVKISPFFQFGDLIRYGVTVLLFIFTFYLVTRFFLSGIKDMRVPLLPLLIIPVLFVIVVETVVSDSIYGNTIVLDTEEGLIFPVINSAQLLVLRFFAYGGLFSTLMAYKKLEVSIDQEQTILLLQQQTMNQEVYIREAKARYQQASSFRHDIQNHLLVLHQLIRDGKIPEATGYLENLETASKSLLLPVHTGNAVVDALLSSKLGVAAQKGIKIAISILIPEQSLINDLDWCIVFSNAVDNAIKASEELSEKDRQIDLSGTRKGNIYLLNVKNNCRKGTPPPLEGIGLSNIRAILKKYNGNMEVVVTNHTFDLNMLFIIPQHPKDIPQQSY